MLSQALDSIAIVQPFLLRQVLPSHAIFAHHISHIVPGDVSIASPALHLLCPHLICHSGVVLVACECHYRRLHSHAPRVVSGIVQFLKGVLKSEESELLDVISDLPNTDAEFAGSLIPVERLQLVDLIEYDEIAPALTLRTGRAHH